jgi:hypothetical protein
MKERVVILIFLFICFFTSAALVALPERDGPDGGVLRKPVEIGHRRTKASFQAELARLKKRVRQDDSRKLFEDVERKMRELRLVERFDEKRPPETPMHSPRGKRVVFQVPEEVYYLKLLELKKELEKKVGRED